MKNKTFGNIIESEPLYITTPQLDANGNIKYKDNGEPVLENKKNYNRFHINGIEFYNQEDKVSARDFNRPIRQLYEDTESIYDILQTMSKIILGDKKTSIIPGLLEEFNPKELKIGKFFNLASEQYIRIPTGAFIINKENKSKNTAINNKTFYKLYNEPEYNKDYIKRDRNSVFVYNRPNIEKFERELGEHFNVDLNEQSNNINVNYVIQDKKDKNGKEILYTCDIAKTRYNVNNEEIEEIYTYTSKVTNNIIQKKFNIFDLVTQSLENGAISSFVTKDGLYSLEEMIPINDLVSNRFKNIEGDSASKKCSIYYNMDLDDFESDAISLTQNYSLIFEETGKVPKTSQIHLFDFIITYSRVSGTFKIEEPELKLETLNRSTLDVKNINVSNNYITVDNEDWFRCRSTDLADMILTPENNAIISREDPNFK